MLEAMSAALVGDDVWGDDPTVSKLQQVAAEQAGKEAAVFFPSGTQSNLAALMAHCQRGDEYIVGQDAHTYRYEGGGAAVLGSIQPQPIENALDGTLPLEKIRAAVKPDDSHFARTQLLALENTIGGKVLPEAYVQEAARLVRDLGIGFHLDGARAWNAGVASGRSIADICAPYDSVSLCFSKGLGAPIGSVLVGSKDLMDIARRWRKVLGGGMRQSGYLAAACLYALEHHVSRLSEDHANAQILAAGLDGVDEIRVKAVATNMVFAEVPAEHCNPLQDYLRDNGILAAVGRTTRFVTHLDVGADQLHRVVSTIKGYFRLQGNGRSDGAEAMAQAMGTSGPYRAH
ncbi:low-specificity L-threonine aldolase [Microvirga sp. VF16]|uniref:low-specificity L-threonine aldolase n=1 Tax=Microvirga sp. VF16 TaxID=2807101 RepID=UPI001FEFE9DF|nr:low-specificity L-threonine aldolase [Microvirga sp. VF16]